MTIIDKHHTMLDQLLLQTKANLFHPINTRQIDVSSHFRLGHTLYAFYQSAPRAKQLGLLEWLANLILLPFRVASTTNSASVIVKHKYSDSSIINTRLALWLSKYMVNT